MFRVRDLVNTTTTTTQVWCLSNCAPPPERTRCRLLDADGLLDETDETANNNNNNNNNNDDDNNNVGTDAQRGTTRLGLAPWSDYVAGLGRWRAWNVSRCGRYRARWGRERAEGRRAGQRGGALGRGSPASRAGG